MAPLKGGFMDRKIQKLVLPVKFLDEDGKMEFVLQFVSMLEEQKQNRVLDVLLDKALSARYPYEGIAIWMEARFIKNMDLPPMEVARMCCHYFGFKRKMLPLLIKIAQRVKDRIRKRVGYRPARVLSPPIKESYPATEGDNSGLMGFVAPPVKPLYGEVDDAAGIDSRV
jgi:hypothetical protein